MEKWKNVKKLDQQDYKEEKIGQQLGREFLEKTKKQINTYKSLAEKAINQIRDDEKLSYCIDKESNSIAIIIKHLEGNMRSRWVDFFATDGEKPTRHRPQEFERTFRPNRAELMTLWDNGWKIFFDALDQLSPDDLLKTISIRKEPLTVMDAVLRQVVHYASHIGQILFIAKHLEWEHWNHVTLERDAEVLDVQDMKK